MSQIRLAEQEEARPRISWHVYGYTLGASLSSLVYGYNTGIIAPAILFLPGSLTLSTFETAAIVSIILVGATVGSLVSGLLADRLGRRRVLALNNTVMLSAAVMATLGESSWLLFVSRFILGLGVGVASVVPALYITEMAPAHVRGQLGAVNQLLGWTGIIIAYFVGYEMVTCTAGDLCWRYMFASGAVLCVFHLMVALAILPETPRWLVNHGRDEEAILVLSCIYAAGCERHIEESYNILLERHRLQYSCAPSARLFAPTNRRPVVVALLLQLFQQATGNSAVVYYSSLVIHRLGFRARDALLFNAWAAVPQLVVLFLVVFSLDRTGRKPALMLSELGIVFSLLVMGFAMTVEDVRSQFWMLLMGIILHRVFFAAGMGPVPSVLAAEMLPYSVRSRGLAVSLTVNWLANFVVTASFPLLLDYVEPVLVYVGFASISLLGLGFVTLCIRETKGMALDPRHQLLDGRDGDLPELEPSLSSPPVPIRTPEQKIGLCRVA